MNPSTFRKIRTLVVDDEEIACEGLRMMLEKDPEIELVDICVSGIDAIKKIKLLQPDLLFLDIQMPKVNGFEVLEALTPEERPITVFVTAYDDYALKAFEVNAVDYLLKPFDDARFNQALEKSKEYFRKSKSLELQERIQQLLNQIRREDTEATRVKPYLKRLIIKNNREMVFVKIEDIDWIEADDYYVRIHAGDKRYLLRESMNNLEAQLDPSVMFRIHRSTIINVDRIKLIQQYSNNEYVVITHCGRKFDLSRSRKESLKALLGI